MRPLPSAPVGLLLRLGAVLLVAGALAAPAPAQGVSGLIGQQSSSREVDPDAIRTSAASSFAQAVEARLALTEGARTERLEHAEALSEERRRTLRDEVVARFERGVGQLLADLRADGMLFASEVSAALPALRAQHLDWLEQVVEAEALGFAPPPRREEVASDRAYEAALLHYVFLHRNAWYDWLTLLGGMVLGFGLAVGVLKVSKWGLGKQGGGWPKRLARAVVGNLHGPLYLICAAGGLGFGLRAVWLPPELNDPVWVVLLALMFIGAFWLCWRLSETVTRRVGNWATPKGDIPGEQVLEIVRNLLRLGLIVLFGFLGVGIIFGTDPTALIAGLGIIGLAVTLAAQDTLKDLLAAVTIHVNRPFQLGDLVRYDVYFGTIEEIGFRMTRIRTLDGHLVTVPNAKMVTEPVENVDARPHIRRRFRVDLPYDTPVERVRRAVEVVREVVREQGELDDEREVQVHFDEFGPHSLRLLVQYHYAEGDYWKSMEHATKIDLALVERFRKEGIDFAFPTQTLHLIREDVEETEEEDEA